MNAGDKRSANADAARAGSGWSLRQRAESVFGCSPDHLSEQLEVTLPAATQRTLHELRVHQIELEMQNEELRRTQAELDSSQARYFDFYDMAPVGYCSVDNSGLIQQANLTIAALIGQTRNALLQQSITRWILPDDQNIYYLMRQRIIASTEAQFCELRMVKADGTPFWAHLVALAVHDESGTPILRVVLTNITDRKQAEKELEFARKLAIEGEEKGKQAAELVVVNEQMKRDVTELQIAFLRTVDVATILTEMRDPFTAGHERRVAMIAVAIGIELGFDLRRQEVLRVAAYLHDIGKITIPTETLAKPGKLSPVEYRMIQQHAQAGYEVLKKAEFPSQIDEIVLQHHERMDGSGYPQGLKGEAILPEARIIAVADVVEAMSSHRPYRSAKGIDAAMAEIERGRETLYDGDVVDACLRLVREKGYTIAE